MLCGCKSLVEVVLVVLTLLLMCVTSFHPHFLQEAFFLYPFVNNLQSFSFKGEFGVLTPPLHLLDATSATLPHVPKEPTAALALRQRKNSRGGVLRLFLAAETLQSAKKQCSASSRQ